MKSHYNEKYFQWQKKAGEYGADQDLWMYEPYITNSDVVLDFGCGGGYMLERLTCKEKYGVDINVIAQKEAKRKNINVFRSIDAMPRELRFNTIISHHTLEHTGNPAEILKKLQKHLGKKGLLVCVVPIDDWRMQKKYSRNDINRHLYTWTPLLIGNLFAHCGYSIKNVDIITRAWLPLSRYYYAYFPKFLYVFLSTIWSILILSRQIRIVAVADEYR